MTLPKTSSIEIPILQELVATGGVENIFFLYERLIAYFPQITSNEISEIKTGTNKSWRNIVQKTGKILEEKDFIKRERGRWTVTEKGKIEVKGESTGFEVKETVIESASHTDIQKMLVEIGRNLGYFAAVEFEYYDVVWRETPGNQRLSHVFEVQSRGNIDSAFAKLKRAYDAQRTKPFLIISTENDFRRAIQSLEREFHDIKDKVKVLTFPQIKLVHQNLSAIGEIIHELLLK